MKFFVKTLLLSGAILLSPAYTQAQAPDAEQAAAVIEEARDMSEEQVLEAPPAGVLDDLESQLDNLEQALKDAEEDIDEAGLPVIDPNNAPDVFYDSMPVRRGVQPTAPEKVDPFARPAGKIVHVTKNHDADDDQAILVSAQRALSLGRFDAALSFYDQLYVKNARDPRVLMGKAIALQKLNRIQTAIKTYEELLDVNPDNVDAEISMLGLVKVRFPAMALKRMLELYDDNPNNAGLNAQIGMTYAGINNLRDALRYLAIASSLEPNNASYVYNLAVVSDQAGNIKQAVRFYEESLDKDRLYSGDGLVPREAIYDRLAVIRQRL